MEKLKNFFKTVWTRIINPSIVQIISAVVAGTAFIAVAIVLSINGVGDIGACVCYVLAFISLVYIVYIIFYGYPRVKQRTLEFASRYQFTDNLVKNYGFRTMVIACASLALNALYAIYNGAIALHYASVSSAVFAAYYLLIAILRGSVLTGARTGGNEDLTQEERRVRSINLFVRCGIFLIVLTCLVLVAMVRSVLSESAQNRSVYLVIASAAYTFIRFALAIHNIRKAGKSDDYGTKTLRYIGFADAVVALYVLQISLTSSNGSDSFNRIMTTAFGNAVCAVIIILGIFMIVKGRCALKSLNPPPAAENDQ